MKHNGESKGRQTALHKKKLAFLLANCYSFTVNGILVLMTGAILPYLLEDYQLGYDQGGALLMLQAIGNLISGALSGAVSVYAGRRTTLAIGAAAFAIGFGGLAVFSVPVLLYLFIFISGLGWGTVNNLSNVLVSEYTDGDAAVINLLHMSFGAGAFLAPFMVSLAVSAGLGWRSAVALEVLLSIVLLTVFLRMNMTTGSEPELKQGMTLHFLKDFRFYLFMLILFLYVGSENSINGWLATYLTGKGIADDFAARRLLSLLWLSVIGGRLLCAWSARYVSREVMLLAGASGSVLSFAAILVFPSLLILTASVVSLGVFLAGIYPNTVANAGNLIKGSGIASGLMFSCGGLGASVIPFIVGLRAESAGIGAGMGLAAISLAGLLALCIINLITARKKGNSDH